MDKSTPYARHATRIGGFNQAQNVHEFKQAKQIRKLTQTYSETKQNIKRKRRNTKIQDFSKTLFQGSVKFNQYARQSSINNPKKEITMQTQYACHFK